MTTKNHIHSLMSYQEVTSSDLSRNSKAAFMLASQHPVRVVRRDGENYVLMTEQEEHKRHILSEYTAQILAATTRSAGSLEDNLVDVFPWIYFLAAEDKAQCAQDIVNSARDALTGGSIDFFLTEIESWKESAYARKHGLFQDPIDWLNEPIRVERP